ncbi:hypothetical protein CIHG_07273 [Coccidioides immitis H538.4]|uniref:Uncharacterized protein n=3 Tax=Coccidioides immitis TaxID=5501 RepID=A0A0J8R9S0_COCIT|nr:hypothetical protein CIRG_09176 [Coccidioides immitis RMSCC 2394]KMU81160.1 hypothetical protein CISG_02537 [Coccidioides immitis RMSCC 3703]KMU89466.1 hypothetical protein CIHG_07273 [Coccidioides immitis H538.4]
MGDDSCGHRVGNDLSSLGTSELPQVSMRSDLPAHIPIRTGAQMKGALVQNNHANRYFDTPVAACRWSCSRGGSLHTGYQKDISVDTFYVLPTNGAIYRNQSAYEVQSVT